MKLLFINQLIILILFNSNFRFVNLIVVTDGIKFPSLITATIASPPPLLADDRSYVTATIAAPSPLVLPNPEIPGKLTDIYKPTATSGSGVTVISSGKSDGHQHQQDKAIGSDDAFIEETIKKYKARHKELEHKSSGKGGKSFHVSEKGAKGDSAKENHNKEYEDEGGKDHEDYDEESHADHHHKYHGGEAKRKFHKKNRDSKRRSEKGFRNKYHKNEHHKLDDFFNNFNENGEYQNYGKKISKKNKVFKTSKKGDHKSRKRNESTVHKKGPIIIKHT